MEEGYRLAVHTELGDVERLAPEWGRLVNRADSSAFASPAAILTWFRLVEGHSGVYVLSVWNGDRLVGIAPHSTVRIGPFVLYCTAGAGFGLYGDPVLEAGEEQSIARVIVDHFSDVLSSGLSGLYLRRVRTDSPTLATLAGRGDVAVRPLFEDEENLVVDFDQMDAEEYFEGRSKKHQVPRLYRRLGEEFADVSYVAEDPDPESAIADMRDMMQRRFDEDLRMFGTPQNRELTNSLTDSLTSTGFGRVGSLMLDGRRCAVALLPKTQIHTIWYSVSYEPELRKFSLGHVEPFEMLRSAYDSGVRKVDLGDARFEYKKTWANSSLALRTAVVTSKGLRGDIANQLRRVAIRAHRKRGLSDAPGVGPHIV